VTLKPKHLSYFVAVAEAGQMTRAARTLHIAQPALAQAISQLEAQVGVKLLERHASGVTVTAAGRIFLEKARIALAAQEDAAAMAASLLRDLRGAIQIGFLSASPTLMAPELLEAFAAANPQVEISSRELRFPTSSTASWLADVDVALCHSPVADPEVEILTLRRDARMVVLRRDHRLAGRTALRLKDVLDETFYGIHPAGASAWAPFWSLDDHRGGPPTALTGDQAGNMLELVAAMTHGCAITTCPEPVAAVIAELATDLVALPLTDAAPASRVLAWHSSRRSSAVDEFVKIARRLTGSGTVTQPAKGRPRPAARTGRARAPRAAAAG
jgi:DNA-binding transcriptional LysR family regulator